MRPLAFTACPRVVRVPGGLTAILTLAIAAGCSDNSSEPSPQTYTVGGTVSGLTAGKSLVLRNNGGDDRTVSGNGPFTFPTGLRDGAAYAVTVSTPPAGMSCPVTGGTGVIAAADVTAIQVICAAIITALDPGFGPGGAGFVTRDGGSNGDDSGNEMTLDGSGRIVVVGHSLNGTTGALEMALWRFSTDGTPDGGFGSGGMVRHPAEVVTGPGLPQVIGSSVQVDGAGRPVVAGWDIDAAGFWGVTVWRFTTGGTPDATFGTGGFVRATSPQSAGVGLAIDGSGRILVSGFSWNGIDWDATLWRFTANGVPDSSFNGVGYATQNYSAGSGQTMGEDIAVGVAVDGTGRVLMAGYSSNASGNQDMTIWRFNDDGTPDGTFGSGGVFRHDNAGGGGGNDVGRTIAFDASNRILVAGWSPSAAGGDDAAVWRLTSGGALDGGFNGQGFRSVNGSAGGDANDTARDVAIDGSGRIVLVGESSNAAGNLDLVVWRYTTAGAPDPTFGNGGAFVHAAAAGGTDANDAGRGVAIDASQRIVVTGRSTTAAGSLDMAVWRIVP